MMTRRHVFAPTVGMFNVAFFAAHGCPRWMVIMQLVAIATILIGWALGGRSWGEPRRRP